MIDQHDVVVTLSRTSAGPHRERQPAAGVRVAIVARHNLVRRGLERILTDGSSVRVVAAAGDLSDLDLPASAPDVIVLELPSNGDHTEQLEMLVALAEHGRVLVLTEAVDGPGLTGLVRAGARGCVVGDVEDHELLQAVEAVARGGFHVSPGLAPRPCAEWGRSPLSVTPALDQGEAETLRWLTEGFTYDQIARQMGVTESVVSTYVARIRGKLDVGTRVELSRLAVEWGLLDEATGRSRALPAWFSA